MWKLDLVWYSTVLRNRCVVRLYQECRRVYVTFLANYVKCFLSFCKSERLSTNNLRQTTCGVHGFRPEDLFFGDHIYNGRNRWFPAWRPFFYFWDHQLSLTLSVAVYRRLKEVAKHWYRRWQPLYATMLMYIKENFYKTMLPVQLV